VHAASLPGAVLRFEGGGDRYLSDPFGEARHLSFGAAVAVSVL